MRSKLLYLHHDPDGASLIGRLFLVLLFMGCCLAVNAQQFGANPPSIKWRQLKTDSVNIIFPRGADSTAFQVAALIKRLQRAKNYRLGERLENTPVVLQSATVNSNGYVGLGPFRSEFYLSPQKDVMDLGSLDWATTLTLHEYRHIMQYNNINRSIIRGVDAVLGDHGRALLSDMAVPNWFFEGDAVYSETLHSTQGRGRLPRFMNSYPTLHKDGRHYHYQKWRNGSYKDYIPGHYNLGYLLVAYGYKKYGADFWGKVIRDAARYKGLFYPFQQAIKTNAQVSFRRFRQAALKDYLQRFDSLAWKPIQTSTASRLVADSLQLLTKTLSEQVVDYWYPYPAAPGFSTAEAAGDSLRQVEPSGVIALKQPSKQVSRFVYLKKVHGQIIQQDLGQAPITRNPYFGYNGDYIIYTRLQRDPRWGYKGYSDLEVLQIRNGKRKRITRKGRYFTPDIAPRMQPNQSEIHGQIPLVAASQMNQDGSSAVVVLDQKGRVRQKWAAPGGTLYSYPKFFYLSHQGFADKDSTLALVFIMRKSNGQMGLSYVIVGDQNKKDSTERAVHTLLPCSEQLITTPVVLNKQLFYTCVRPGKSDPYTEIYQMDLSGLHPKQVILPRAKLIATTIRDVRQAYGLLDHTVVASLQTAAGYGLFSWLNEGQNKNSGAQQPRLPGSRQGAYFQGYLPIGGWPLTSKDSNDGRKPEQSKGANSAMANPCPNAGHDKAPVFAGSAATKSGGSAPAAVTSTDRSKAKIRQLQQYKAALKPYPLLSHPFNFHSLQPTIEDPVYSLDLLGQNILNTLQTKLSYGYNRVTEISTAGADLSLGLWYVQPYLHVDYSWNHLAANHKGQHFSYRELTSQAGVQLPLNFTGGRWSRSLYLSTALSQSNLYWMDPGPKPGAALTELRYLFSRMQFSMYCRQASRQIYPRLGLYNYTELHTPLDGQGARGWMNSTTLYLPGVRSTHSLRWSLAYQKRNQTGRYGYTSRFAFSRGYTRPDFKTMWKFSVDYDLPLCYPDVGFGGLIYVLRLRGNMYLDQSYGFDNKDKRSSYGSVGGALFADIHIGNQYPMTIGVRYNHLLNAAFPLKNNWELILPIKIF